MTKEYEKEFLTKLYMNLLETRMSEEKLVEVYSVGKIPGHIHSGLGEEAAYAGTLMAKKDGDYFKGGHRVLSATHLMGVPFEAMYSEIMGKATGTSGARGGCNHVADLEKGVLGTAGSLGCDMVVSVGAALSSQYLKNGRVVFAYYGDGTSSRGTLHEAMNLAAVWKLPIFFICTDNQYAISANHANTVPVPNPGYDRASAYGMPARVVDGTDVLAVYEAAQELLEHIRSGKGPALLETKCYRWRGHFEGDMCAYRDAGVTEKEKKTRDCVAKFEAYLKENGVMTEEDFELERNEIALQLEKAVEFAENAPIPDVDKIFDGLYA